MGRCRAARPQPRASLLVLAQGRSHGFEVLAVELGEGVPGLQGAVDIQGALVTLFRRAQARTVLVSGRRPRGVAECVGTQIVFVERGCLQVTGQRALKVALYLAFPRYVETLAMTCRYVRFFGWTLSSSSNSAADFKRCVAASPGFSMWSAMWPSIAYWKLTAAATAA